MKRKANKKPSHKDWHCHYPNTADWNFDFYKLLSDKKPIGKFYKNSAPEVAIVGAGIAGLLAARELIKAGCKILHIYEASERIGGRNYSIKVKGQEKTTYELGAMRIPLFEYSDVKGVKIHNSVLGHLIELFKISHTDFPTPGSDNCYTGIFINDGHGPNKELLKPTLIKWRKGKPGFEDDIYPISMRDSKLWDVGKKWAKFAKLFKEHSESKYKYPSWKPYWENIVRNYHHMDFRELVFKSDKIWKNTDLSQQGFDDGDFGGLGFNNRLATIFFTVGAGDGGWGAFYDISSLYVIRTLLNGFGDNHRLIVGCNFEELLDENGRRFKKNPYKQKQIIDSLGNVLETPNFLGMQCFSECLFFLPIEGIGRSMYELLSDEENEYEIRLFTQDPVQVIRRQYGNEKEIKLYSKNQCKEYNDVILTTPTWATQVNLNLKFDDDKTDKGRPLDLPDEVSQSMKFSHWITSCKLFFPLKERFWDEDDFPQVILTDTFIQDVYIYAADDKDPGVLIASYTWEDNSMKMLGFKDDDELAESCLRKLDAIFHDCKVKLPGSTKPELLVISNLVNRDAPVVIHWSKKPNYAGCSKLYRQNNEKENYQLLNYNRNHSHNSHLYFAGEAYSVEGGWTEPATRLALDAVIHLIENNKNKKQNVKNLKLDYKIYRDLTDTEYLNRYPS